MFIPAELRKLLGDRPYTLDNVGMSGSYVLCFDDMVLKIGKHTAAHDREVFMLPWMVSKNLPVPQVLHAQVVDGTRYLLMSRVPGKMSCAEEYLDNSDVLLEVLAEGMHMLWETDISDCPCDSRLERHLKAAERHVVNGQVDVNAVEPDTFGPGGFASPEHLLAWLYDNRPTEMPVLSHGDYCLPNIFAENGRLSGFIDLGDSGIADRYQDIALCYRSLTRNMDGSYGGRVREGFNPDRLFDVLGITPDRDLLRYYRLLDELF
ncbi:MAG: aminoglycoside 3'-phosphotransferase [Clostridia bacterium]|nr:aminoglycoside 3'-phosphotransferase [Clostridia bacterium]